MPPAQPPGYYELPGKPPGTVKTVPYNLPEIGALPIIAHLPLIRREGS